MKFKSTKKASDIILEGVTVELDMVDNAVKSVILTDAKGNTVRVIERTYNLYVEVPAPPEMVKRWKLSGHVLDLPLEKVFEHEYEAIEEKSRLEGDAARSKLNVEEIQVVAAA